MKSFIQKHFSKIVIAILATWVLVLITPAKGYLKLTGIFNAPIPDGAEPHDVDPEKGYYLEEISDGVYFVSSFSHNTVFVEAQESVIVIDALPSLGEKYLDAIREVTDKPVSHMIYSHSHHDHIGSAHVFGDDIEIIAHEATKTKLLHANDPDRPIPTLTFDTTYALEVGGRTIELTYYGAAHNPGNIVIYLPNEKVLTMIDIAFPRWVPIHEFAIAEDVGEYFTIYEKLLAYDFTHFIGGHARLGSYQDVVDQRDYVFDVKKSAGQVINKAAFAEVGKKTAGLPNQYLGVKFGLDQLASDCEKRVVDKWGDKLVGADVFTNSHCFKMLFNEVTE